MTLKEQINNDWKDALRNGETLRKDTLSFLRSSIKNLEIEKKGELDDNNVINVINKEISKRNDAAQGFLKGGRTISAEQELKEAVILKHYLPKQISDDELIKIIDSVIANNGAKGIKDMGKVMKDATTQIAGRADNKRISLVIREKLS